jgi:hypothetical protein
MVEYAYTTVTGKIKPLLDKVRTVGVPPKVSVAWLKTIGFTSSNDTTLAGVLKFIGLTDASGIPNATWSAYRGAKHRAVLGEAIRKGYAELFAVYPDANARSNTELQHVFSTSSSAGAQVIGKTVATFKALVDEADFSSTAGASTETTIQTGPLHTPAATLTPRCRLRLCKEAPPFISTFKSTSLLSRVRNRSTKYLRVWPNIFMGVRKVTDVFCSQFCRDCSGDPR